MDDDAAGVPEWVVTYGDMMSLLLTFFIMLVSLSEVVADKRYRAILESIQQYVGYDTAPVAPPGKNYAVNSMVEHLESKLGSFTDEDNGHGGVKTASVEGMDVRVLRTREGSLKQVGNPVLFKPGQAELTDEAKAQIRSAAQEVAGKPNKIEVRGHSSPGRLAAESKFSDKLELTYARSRVVSDFLEKCGIEHDRIRLIAASDTEPPKQTGDQRLQHLDRVEIMISDAFVSEYVGPRDIPD